MKKILLVLCLILFSPVIFSSSFNHIVFLGDSLSDNGNLYRALKIPKTPPYYQGHFSNGPTWAEFVGDYFYQHNYIDTNNYCYGGATAILHNPLTDSFTAPITLEGEVYKYLLNAAFKNKNDVLYGIWIGANDYLYDREPNVEGLTDAIVNKITWSIITLIKQGGQSFLVLNLPDLAKTPYAKENNLTNELHHLSQLHNIKLASAIKQLQQNYPGVNIIYIDIYNLFNDVLDHPEKYNEIYHAHITNTTQPCWLFGWSLKNSPDYPKNMAAATFKNLILKSPALATAYNVGVAYDNGQKPCADADEYIFWDDIHPTALAHRVLGDIVVKAINQQDLGRNK